MNFTSKFQLLLIMDPEEKEKDVNDAYYPRIH
jgi:hypothetical protein